MGLRRDICGGHNPYSLAASNHADSYYESIRKSVGDINRIANNTGLTLEQVSLVKVYIFFAYHDLGRGKNERFFPDYMMSESWRRLSSKNIGNIQHHDMLLLKHELLEIQYIIDGCSQEDAHSKASKEYDYGAAAKKFYREQGFSLR